MMIKLITFLALIINGLVDLRKRYVYSPVFLTTDIVLLIFGDHKAAALIAAAFCIINTKDIIKENFQLCSGDIDAVLLVISSVGIFKALRILELALVITILFYPVMKICTFLKKCYLAGAKNIKVKNCRTEIPFVAFLCMAFYLYIF